MTNLRDLDDTYKYVFTRHVDNVSHEYLNSNKKWVSSMANIGLFSLKEANDIYISSNKVLVPMELNPNQSIIAQLLRS